MYPYSGKHWPLALVLAQELVDRGYENHAGLRWRHRTTNRQVPREQLRDLLYHIDPQIPDTYLRSERIFNDLAFAALAL